jgi:transcriptional regulator with XRE-family HTH domain
MTTTDDRLAALARWADRNPLRRWREGRARPLTQADVARLLVVGPSAVSTWESGTRRPGLRALAAMERITGGAITASVWEAWERDRP